MIIERELTWKSKTSEAIHKVNVDVRGDDMPLPRKLPIFGHVKMETKIRKRDILVRGVTARCTDADQQLYTSLIVDLRLNRWAIVIPLSAIRSLILFPHKDANILVGIIANVASTLKERRNDGCGVFLKN